jgi:acylphosphatase
MEILHYNILVKGKVQGVWFRKYTKERAEALSLNGIVRNNFDNSVYIEVEGTKPNLKHFTDWLYQGSPMSNVTDVNFEQGTLQNFTCFEISY